MTAAVNPDRACPHEDFDVYADVGRITSSDDGPVVAFAVDLRVTCLQCGEPFRWVGVPAGMSPRQPMCNVDETELHAPVRPASSDPDFGLGIPGFAIRQVGP